jgi:hypothetical protein
MDGRSVSHHWIIERVGEYGKVADFRRLPGRISAELAQSTRPRLELSTDGQHWSATPGRIPLGRDTTLIRRAGLSLGRLPCRSETLHSRSVRQASLPTDGTAVSEVCRITASMGLTFAQGAGWNLYFPNERCRNKTAEDTVVQGNHFKRKFQIHGAT